MSHIVDSCPLLAKPDSDLQRLYTADETNVVRHPEAYDNSIVRIMSFSAILVGKVVKKLVFWCVCV